MSVSLERLSGDADDAVAPRAIPLEEQPVIRAEAATLAYGRRVILRDVDLTIRQGEFWFFLGPNGQGKTTLIKALLGAVKPRRGRISLRQDFRRRTKVGFVPQECELNAAAPTTVREFVLSGLVGIPSDPRMRAVRLERLLSLLGLRSAQSQSLWTLSGGQRQRAMVARALIRDPLLLIVDEPTAGLDLGAATGLLELVSELRRKHGITIAFVTHDLQIAARRATHVALFRNGDVLGGAASEVFVDEHLTRTFGIGVNVRQDAEGNRNVETSFIPPARPNASESATPGINEPAAEYESEDETLAKFLKPEGNR